jgi:hypothetical protein
MNSKRSLPHTATHLHAPTYSIQHQAVSKQFLCQQSTSIVARHQTNKFFLRPPRSPYKTLFFSTPWGEILWTMSFAKSVPEGLNLLECEQGIGGKNSPIHYITKKGLFKRPSRKTKRPTTLSWCYLTWAASLKSHYGHPGLLSSLNCMCAKQFTHSNKWSMTLSSTKLMRLFQMQYWEWK